MGRVALVLGAGGVTGGAFHAGVLSALVESTGWDARHADLLVGTSAGSATAGALRAGLPARDMAARARGERLSPEGSAILAAANLPSGPPPVPAGGRVRVGRPVAPEVLGAALRRPWRIRPSAVLAGLLPEGSVPTEGISAAMDAMHRRGWPSAGLWICALRVRDGALVVFGRDGAPSATVGEAVAASCAIPGFFAPVEIGGERYVDGGANSLTNVGVVADGGFDLVLVSAPMSRAGSGRYTPGGAIREVGRVQLRAELQRLRRRGVEVVTFQPTAEDERAMGLNAMDASRRLPVVQQVHESTLRRIEQVAGRLDALRA
jgi:NTE family protein